MAEIIGQIFEVMGTVSVAYMALQVHHRVRHEHKIDEAVFSEMRREWRIGMTGILFIVVGFILQIADKLFL